MGTHTSSMLQEIQRKQLAEIYRDNINTIGEEAHGYRVLLLEHGHSSVVENKLRICEEKIKEYKRKILKWNL